MVSVMPSGLWRCVPNAWLDALGILLNPATLVALIALWGVLTAYRRLREARLAWVLFAVLGLEALVVTVLLVFASALVHWLGGNPTPVTDGGQLVAIGVSWVSLVVVLLRTFRSWAGEEPAPRSEFERAYRRTVADFFLVFGKVTVRACLFVACFVAVIVLAFALGFLTQSVGGDFAPAMASVVTYSAFVAGVVAMLWLYRKGQQRQDAKPPKSVAHVRQRGMGWPVGVVLLATVGIVHVAAPRDSVLVTKNAPYRFALYLFDRVTMGIASDECLAWRVIDYHAAAARLPAHNRDGHGNYQPDMMKILVSEPGSEASSVLGTRGASRYEGEFRTLAWVLEKGDRVEQQVAAQVLFPRAAYDAGAHPVVVKWATSTSKPAGQREVKVMLACVRKNRRDLIGARVDDECNPIAVPVRSRALPLRR
jgi:hypothetical protein